MTGTDASPGGIERLDPRAEGDKLSSAEHLVRYWWASRLVEGRDVLDAGCGIGYGTRMLAAAGAATCTGVDIAPDAVAQASQAGGATFVEADLRSLPFEDASFDVVVCFEALEHVDPGRAVLDELRRVVRPGGRVVISSPNRGVYPPGNPFHVHEYTAAELAAELEQRFAHVHLFRQQPFLASALLGDADAAADADAPPVEAAVHKLTPLSPGDEMFSVAVAGDEPFEPPPSLVALASAFELRWWHDEVENLRRHAAEAERGAAVVREERARLEERLKSTGARLLELESELATLRERSRILEADAERGWNEARKSWAHYNDLEARFLAMEQSRIWSIAKPLRRARQVVRRVTRR